MYASSPTPGPATRKAGTEANPDYDWSTNTYSCKARPVKPASCAASCLMPVLLALSERESAHSIPASRSAGGKGSWRAAAKSPTHTQDLAAKVEAQYAASHELMRSSRMPAFGADHPSLVGHWSAKGVGPVASPTRAHVNACPRRRLE